LLDQDGFFAKHTFAAENSVNPLASRSAHFPAKDKSVIFLFMYGGPSSMDTWDYKPELQKRDGEDVQIEIHRGSIQKQKLLASRRTFQQYGQAGLWGADCFQHINQHLDKL